MRSLLPLVLFSTAVLVVSAPEESRREGSLPGGGGDARAGRGAEGGVAGDLEGQRGQRRVLVGLARDDLVFLADRVALDRADVQRRGQVGDDGGGEGVGRPA